MPVLEAGPLPVPTAQQIRALRERLGLTKTQAARRVHVDKAVWFNWESGRHVPSRQSVALLRLLELGVL